MALTESDLSELLAALEAGEMTDAVRMSLEILQQLIEAEPTAVEGRGPCHERDSDEGGLVHESSP